MADCAVGVYVMLDFGDLGEAVVRLLLHDLLVEGDDVPGDIGVVGLGEREGVCVVPVGMECVGGVRAGWDVGSLPLGACGDEAVDDGGEVEVSSDVEVGDRLEGALCVVDGVVCGGAEEGSEFGQTGGSHCVCGDRSVLIDLSMWKLK